MTRNAFSNSSSRYCNWPHAWLYWLVPSLCPTCPQQVPRQIWVPLVEVWPASSSPKGLGHLPSSLDWVLLIDMVQELQSSTSHKLEGPLLVWPVLSSNCWPLPGWTWVVWWAFQFDLWQLERCGCWRMVHLETLRWSQPITEQIPFLLYPQMLDVTSQHHCLPHSPTNRQRSYIQSTNSLFLTRNEPGVYDVFILL